METKITTMRLTGQCEIDFKRWRIAKKESYLKDWFFEELMPSMQYGVLIDFFESEDIRINIHSEIDYIQAYVNDNDLGNHFQFIKEARTAAIKKANEIYNLR